MPISRTASSTTSGGTSRLTPRASSRSALPHLLETERLPCLATVTPHPATTNAAVVEILKVLRESPPVPHVSTTTSAFVWILIALRRMARAAPASSEKVSPLEARAARMAPICASVTLPDIISPTRSAISCSSRSLRANQPVQALSNHCSFPFVLSLPAAISRKFLRSLFPTGVMMDSG